MTSATAPVADLSEAGRLDLAYLRDTAASLGVQELLAKALRESGYA